MVSSWEFLFLLGRKNPALSFFSKASLKVVYRKLKY